MYYERLDGLMEGKVHIYFKICSKVTQITKNNNPVCLKKRKKENHVAVQETIF